MALRDWVGKAFSDNGQPSSSRLLTLFHSLAAIFVLVFVAVKTHVYPDSVQGAALGGFATVHYAVNRITTAWGRDKQDKPQDGDK
jgi:hypothetical protein